jgi:hypothetical protein
MYNVASIRQAIRPPGLGMGLLTLEVDMSGGRDYALEILIQKLLNESVSEWVTFIGENTTAVGMGQLVHGLSHCGLKVEIEPAEDVKDPGWVHTVDRWVITYRINSPFNHFILRAHDALKFEVREVEDLEITRQGLEKLRLSPSAKYIYLLNKRLYKDAVEVVKEFPKLRLFTR